MLLCLVHIIHVNLIYSRRLSGLAEGVSSLIHCAVRQEWSSIAGCSNLTQFESRYTALLFISTNFPFCFFSWPSTYSFSPLLYCIVPCICINKHLFYIVRFFVYLRYV